VSDIGGPFTDDTTGLSAAASLPVYLAYDPAFEFGLNPLTSKQLETADVESTNIVVEAKYDLGFADIESITGYSGFDSEDGRDVDWTPTSFLYEPISQEFDQFSQEFRIVSDVGDSFDYIAGLYYLSNDFLVDRRTDIDIEAFLIPFGVSPGDEIIFGGPAANWRYAQLRFLDQESETLSAYAQGTWHITPQLHITAGLRWNREKKEAFDRYNLSEFGTDRFLDLVNNQADIDLIDGVRTVLAGNVDGILSNSRDPRNDELTETDWSPEVTVAWDASESMMFYGKYVRGHKGGGFNSQTTGQDTDPKFENETVDGYELGGKFRFSQGYVNVALFRQDFDNLQTSVWTGNEFDVGNAGRSRSQGLELDGYYLLTESLQVNGSLIWLDARFIENELNSCSTTQLSFAAPGCFNLAGQANTDAGAVGPFFQDLSGERFSTQFQGNLGLGYTMPVMSNLEMLLRADATYFGNQENSRDRTNEQPSKTLVDLSATLRQEAGPWSLALLVKNATNKEHWWYEFEAPSQAGTRIGFLAPPRTVALRLNFDLL
jgi:outer membrane receptor protein involved in Fe transport